MAIYRATKTVGTQRSMDLVVLVELVKELVLAIAIVKTFKLGSDLY